MATWLDGLRKEPSTVASYRKNVRLHVEPHIGALRLEQLTGTRLTKLYHELEQAGRFDGRGGLSARTVRYTHTIIHAGLGAAVRDGLLSANPADKADKPSAKAAASPEMHIWTADELRAFLDQRSQVGDELAMAWSLLVATGMRRGEALALRWADVDFDGSRLSVRRSATVIKHKGAGEEIIVGTPKSGKARTINLDPQTLARVKAHKVAQGTLSLALARDDIYVLANLDGTVRHPERFSRKFVAAVIAARKALGEDQLSTIRLHDLRHTHASLLLAAGVPVKVVSERLGHANAMITLGVYAHVIPGMQAEAAAKFGALLSGGA
jgi:Site-specific recombinase XerD